MAIATKDAPVEVAVERLDLRHIELTLVGDSPLIVHAWSDKAKKMMLDKQMKRGSQGKTAKDPEEDYRESLYHHPDGGYGFPTVGVKAAAVRAGTDVGMKMTDIRRSFYIAGEMVKVDGEPRMCEDMVRVGMGTADIRYRGEFPEWTIKLTVTYNARVISVEQLVNLFNVAGFGVGIGEWRPEKSGQFGMFHVGGK